MLPELEPSEPRFRDRFPRPSFMTLTVALALLVTPGVGLLAAEMRDPAAERARLVQEADLTLRADLINQGLTPVEDKTADVLGLSALGIEVFTPERPFRMESGGAMLTGTPVSAQDRDRVLVTLANELARYPADFLARARLRRLVLCANFREGSESIPSLPNYHGALLIDVDAEAPYLRRLLHHEIFHFADYADDDQLSHDPAWLALNDRYFVYGSGGRFAREPGAGRFTAEIPGFVSRYATSALEEDKAETFAMRMSAPQQFAELTAADPILRAKSAALEVQLRKLSSAMDPRFFAAIDRR
ncbi:MAG TPA: hypothetical protein VER96_30130 [Polyangiaceae bacterium]|nr:hypothetical protein [Polyangiaceae bacterium]